jgi:hypothetical protein
MVYSRLRAALPVLLLLTLALWQFTQVHSQGWNSWRGGGFGMYAGFHPHHGEAWVWFGDSPAPTRIVRHAITPTPLAGLLHTCLVQLTEACLERVQRRLPPTMPVDRIELWRLTFNPATRVLGRELVAAVGAPRRP